MEDWIKIKDLKIRYYKKGKGKEIVFLHGYSFNIETWLSINILEDLSNKFLVYAIDMPYGIKSKSDKFFAKDNEEYALFLKEIFDKLNIKEPIIVGASISGEITLRYITNFKAKAAVVISPTRVERLKERLKNLSIPLLIFWGKEDNIVPINNAEILKNLIKNSKVYIIRNASHACYLDKPHEFKQVLKEFLKEF